MHSPVRTPTLPEGEVCPVKAKKPLLITVFAVVLLAVALVLPAVTWGKPTTPAANKPVSWVSVGTNFWQGDDPGEFHGGTAAKVQKLADNSVRGQVVVKVFREFWLTGEDDTATLFHYFVKTKDFASPDFWDAPLGYGLAHADFYVGAEGNAWPADLGDEPEGWPFEGAAIADFVAYVPVSEYPESLPWVGWFGDVPSIPYRFMFVDFGEPGAADLMLNWLFIGSWYPTVWVTPIPAGNIQVHVGN